MHLPEISRHISVYYGNQWYSHSVCSWDSMKRDRYMIIFPYDSCSRKYMIITTTVTSHDPYSGHMKWLVIVYFYHHKGFPCTLLILYIWFPQYPKITCVYLSKINWLLSTVRAKKILPSWRQPEGAAKSRSQFLSADGGFRRSAHPSVWHAIYASRRELKAPPIDIGR